MIFNDKKAGKAKFVMLSCICLLAAVTAAQGQSVGDEIVLPEREVTLRELFGQIKRQTGRTVVFSPDGTTLGKRVMLPEREGTVAAILTKVLPGEGLDWKAVENYIVVGPARPVVKTPPVAEPIRVDRNELRSFANEPERGPDSIYYRTVKRGPFEFTTPDRKFAIPGGKAVSVGASSRQVARFAIKSNILHAVAGLAANIYGEAALGPLITIEAGFARNGLNRYGTAGHNRKLIHGGVNLEVRRWSCERFNGHYFGVHTFWRFYNAGGHRVPFVGFERGYRYEGTAIGAGVSYGYSLPAAPRLNVEFSFGAGVARMNYDMYGCDKCANLVRKVSKTYFGPTRAGVTLSFIVK